MPLTEGPHAIFVRATDINGQTAESNAVHIQASAAAGLIAVHTALEGDTIQSLAEQIGMTPEKIADENPSIDPSGPIPPGTQVFISFQPFSLPAGGEPPIPPDPMDPLSRLKKVSLWSGFLSGRRFEPEFESARCAFAFRVR